jgi:arginine-tRNA-protein transferase
MSATSIVDYWGPRSGGHCGYCSGCGKYSNSIGAEILTCSDYQDLMDQGWRRCAKMCYKFQMDKTCCPAYTIKCDAVNFELSKSQKKILKKFRNFVINGKNLMKMQISMLMTKSKLIQDRIKVQ